MPSTNKASSNLFRQRESDEALKHIKKEPSTLFSLVKPHKNLQFYFSFFFFYYIVPRDQNQSANNHYHYYHIQTHNSI